MKCILLLPSVHQVMKAEKILKGRGIGVDLIPVPREISSDCGVAVEISVDSEDEAFRALEENKMRFIECYVRGPSGEFKKTERHFLPSGADGKHGGE
jgi:hypothetical protein